jgi:Protein of unknown function (DUF3800)
MPVDPHAFCDESKAPPVFTLAGYVASCSEWDGFDQAWHSALKYERLEEFHAQHCFNGEKEFEGQSRSERDRVLRHFVSVILESNLLGVWCAIDLEAFGARASKLSVADFKRGYYDPYYLGFQFQVLLMSTCEPIAALPEVERILFTFDRNGGFEGNALEMFAEAKKSSPYRGRLGRARFDGSEHWPGLQAADLLTYYTRKYLVEGRQGRITLRTREVVLRLCSKGHMMGRFLDADDMTPLFEELEGIGAPWITIRAGTQILGSKT